MQKFNLIMAALLIVGLVIGAGIGSLAFPKTVTETETQTLTTTETLTQVDTVTQTIRETIRETEVRSTILTETTYITETKTMTRTTTVTKTELTFMTITKRVYPAESEAVLLTESGSGYKNTRPFTLNETADLKIVVTIYPRAELKYVGLSWYLVPVGAEKYEYVDHGSVNEESGTIEFYATIVPPGSYYLSVNSANCKWTIKVEKVAAE